MAVYGYIRVSTNDQNTARQYAALEKWEIPKRNLYVNVNHLRKEVKTWATDLI